MNEEALKVIDRLVSAFCANQKKDGGLSASDFAFSIELSTQLCLQTLSSLKKGDVESLSALSGHVAKVLAHTKRVVSEALASDDVETHDPFNDFMAAGDAKKGKNAKEGADEDMNDDDEDEEDNVENELLPSYQMLLSLVSLLTRMEATRSTKLANTALLLKDLS